jgi:hypothetical protein
LNEGFEGPEGRTIYGNKEGERKRKREGGRGGGGGSVPP